MWLRFHQQGRPRLASMAGHGRPSPGLAVLPPPFHLWQKPSSRCPRAVPCRALAKRAVPWRPGPCRANVFDICCIFRLVFVSFVCYLLVMCFLLIFLQLFLFCCALQKKRHIFFLLRKSHVVILLKLYALIPRLFLL